MTGVGVEGTPRHGYISANGLRLHHLDFGGTGRPTICLHGITSHAWSWVEVAAGLAGTGRVVAADLRGHGDSQWSASGAYGTDPAAEDVACLVATLGTEPVDFVGASWGGLIGLALADRQPSPVRRLVIIDLPPSSTASADDVPPRPAAFARWEDARDWERSKNPRAAESTITLLADHGYRPGEHGSMVRRSDPAFLTHWAFREEDHWARLGRIRQPTLVVRGAASPMVPDAVADRMTATLHDGRLATIPDAGHSVHLDNPGGLVAVLRPFLEG